MGKKRTKSTGEGRWRPEQEEFVRALLGRDMDGWHIEYATEDYRILRRGAMENGEQIHPAYDHAEVMRALREWKRHSIELPMLRHLRRLCKEARERERQKHRSRRTKKRQWADHE